MKMADKKIYTEKKVGKSQKKGNSKVYDLVKEIEEIRNKLNREVSEENKKLTSTEILELSQKLDELIVKYLGK